VELDRDTTDDAAPVILLVSLVRPFSRTEVTVKAELADEDVLDLAPEFLEVGNETVKYAAAELDDGLLGDVTLEEEVVTELLGGKRGSKDEVVLFAREVVELDFDVLIGDVDPVDSIGVTGEVEFPPNGEVCATCRACKIADKISRPTSGFVEGTEPYLACITLTSAEYTLSSQNRISTFCSAIW
jgi:hypothetical protein